MDRMRDTIVGTFNWSKEYKDELIKRGYRNLDWQNGWSEKQWEEWRELKKDDDPIEDIQWNRSGSDVTYTIHAKKVFCSVDMGD